MMIPVCHACSTRLTKRKPHGNRIILIGLSPLSPSLCYASHPRTLWREAWPRAVTVNTSSVAPFRPFEAPRLARTQRHLLRALLGLAWGPRRGGGAGLPAMEGCDKRQRAWRPPFLALPHGLPAHAPCGR